MRIINLPNPYGGGFQEPTMIVIHAMSEYVYFEKKWRYAPEHLMKMKYSAHALIDVEGNIIKCRNGNLIGYHAKGFNTNTIGIEVLVEGRNTYEDFLKKIKTPWVKPKQMEATIYACRSYKLSFDIKHIKQHSDIDPKRKYDPGEGFDFNYLLKHC